MGKEKGGRAIQSQNTNQSIKCRKITPQSLRYIKKMNTRTLIIVGKDACS